MGPLEEYIYKLAKAIHNKYDENPAYYDSFSKRIKATL